MVSDPAELDDAWSQQYSNLSNHIVPLLPRKRGVIAEVGCGRGQLTIPLAKLAPGLQFVCVDRFKGPYKNDNRHFVQGIARNRLKKRVSLITSNYAEWQSKEPDDSYDATLSSEFLPEIGSHSMARFFAECYRILRPGGVTVHSFLSASARNAGQRLLIEADSDPKWTKDSPEEWFSPPTRFATSGIREAGFRKIQSQTIKSNLVIKGAAARVLLKDWGVKDAFWRTHRERLATGGLGIPDRVVLCGSKPVC